MDWVIVAAIVLAGGLIAGALVATRRRQREPLAQELGGRLAQMADTQTSGQAQIGERLQAQERALAKLMEERLHNVTVRVNDTLERTTAQQRTALDALGERLVKIDAAQKNITELSRDVVGLQDILGNKQARGAFGEVQLRDLVDAVLPPSARQYQALVGGTKRADCLLMLPNPPGPMVVDAKFPLESYRAWLAAADDAGRKVARRTLAADVRKHIDDIATKYIVPGETAESALMFLPSEAVYAELHASFNEVIEASYKARVFIVSPTTLWATLNTMRAVMKDVRMREAAGLIQVEVGKLAEDVLRLDKRTANLQKHFGQVSEDVREIRISAEKIVKRGDDIQLLQVADEGADDRETIVDDVAEADLLTRDGPRLVS